MLNLTFSVLAEQYQFEKNDNYILIETDFEFISINKTNSNNYFTECSDLIRFISNDFEEDEYQRSDHNIHAVYFLPSHKQKELIKHINQEEIIDELEVYYTLEMKESFRVSYSIRREVVNIPHRDRSSCSTSFYGVDEEVGLDALIKTAEELLKLNAMKDFEIAVGTIFGEMGLLEKGYKIKTENPQSKHYNFWKFCERKTGKSFFDIGKSFKMISREEVSL
ncbi:hypothetical protein NKT34_08780 [Paenibacillus polysaccharolyticus]|uniref:hypothetical protein n=1 Tax=Paenibacillus polysaccharolyticus TaxID=582692 RepID=UPI00209CBDFA|nr:hypothetical protein [Paenibacillus polysaccharolyticus]MCP1133383.1 hypothetical protein [Paenibacillus polysaccharolyticus]